MSAKLRAIATKDAGIGSHEPFEQMTAKFCVIDTQRDKHIYAHAVTNPREAARRDPDYKTQRKRMVWKACRNTVLRYRR
jgi:hypothetical protein